MIKILILDDEQNAIEYLKNIIEINIPNTKLIFATTDHKEAQNFMETENPQLIFLDVEMPTQSGFDFLLSQKEKNFDVIFTTAFSKYAIQAIRFSAIDFLLKPVQIDELKEAYQRFLNQPKEVERRQKLYEHLFENLKTKNETAFKLSLTKGSRQYFISPQEIYYCRADDNYTKLYLKDNTEFIISRTLKEVDEMLTPHQFIRTHKSSLVNKNYMQELSKEGTLALKNNVLIEVSRRRLDNIKEIFSEGKIN
jgi:two-component system, LytTR family, response regulator